MLAAGISIRQIAAATSLVVLLACLAISVKRNSIDSRFTNRDELVVIAPNPTAVCDVQSRNAPICSGH